MGVVHVESLFEGSRLKDLNGEVIPGEEVAASDIYKDAPTVVVVIRRPGCVACRDTAQKLWARKSDFDDLGVQMVAVVHQGFPGEIKRFKAGYWPGSVFLDSEKKFYETVGEGKVRVGSLRWLLNPFSRAWRNIRAAIRGGVSGNFAGDGTTLGGLLVLAAGGGIEYAFQETDFGDAAPVEDVLAAAKRAAGK
ncbi:unnamed protein product [Pedinophyceae sp. YPF-701]|nr:unnamed protein product [Pedinophyceae sp. YPF-701]